MTIPESSDENNSAQLVAGGLFADARIAQAKKLLLEAVLSHQTKITGVRPPIPAFKQSYQEMLDTFAEYRGAKLFYPYIGSGIGNGPLVELADGSVKYDFISGIGPHYWGHSHPELIASSIDAALSNTIMQGHLQQNMDSFELCGLLIKASKMDHCFLTTSGAMANENALKIAFQKRHPASRILAFDRCFVGRTLTISQITDKASFREGLPVNALVDYVPFFDYRKPEESTRMAVDCIKKFIKRYPKQHAVMCLEFIQGEGGFYHGTGDFFKAVISILRENQIAVFADEVQSFARTPELFAYQYFGLESLIDIASIGKVSQVCATFFTEEYKPRPGLLSQTFTGSTSAIKASILLITELLKGGYFGDEGKIAQMHSFFAGQLEELSKRHPHLIRGPYGVGCMVAITPFDGEAHKATRFAHKLFDAGVISFTAGSDPTRIRFLIPIGAVTQQDIKNVVSIIEDVLIQIHHDEGQNNDHYQADQKKGY